MADTYYGYAERDANSYVNWAEIGKGMTDMLQETNRIREQKKAEIDEASREFGAYVSNLPQGENENENQRIFDFSNDVTEYNLQLTKLLKSGQISLKQYLTKRQNLVDGTYNLYDLSKQFQDVYKMKMDRYKNNESQPLEVDLMGQVEKMYDINKYKPIISTATGEVSIARMEAGPDGVMRMSTDPNTFGTVSNLLARIKSKYDKFDYNKAVKTTVDSMGEEINAFKKLGGPNYTGSITELVDITKRKNLGAYQSFEKAETSKIDALLVNPFNRLSVLTADMGYTNTFDPEEAKKDPHKVLLVQEASGRSPVPKFTDEQLKASTEWMRTQMRLAYDKKEKITAVTEPEPSQASIERGESAKKDVDTANMLGYLYYGNTNEKNAAMQYFRDSVPGMISVVPEMNDNNQPTGNIKFTYKETLKDGTVTTKTKTLSTGNGRMSQEDFIRSGAALTGIKDINQALRSGYYKRGGAYNPYFSLKRFATTTEEQGENPVDKYSSFVDGKLSKLTGDQSSDIDLLNSNYGALGFVFGEGKNGGVSISYGDKVIVPDVNLSNPNIALSSIKDALKINIPGEKEEEKYMWASRLNQQGLFNTAGSTPAATPITKAPR